MATIPSRSQARPGNALRRRLRLQVASELARQILGVHCVPRQSLGTRRLNTWREKVAFLNRFEENTHTAGLPPPRVLPAYPWEVITMQGIQAFSLTLLALSAIAIPETALAAGDLYDKGPAKTMTAGLPT